MKSYFPIENIALANSEGGQTKGVCKNIKTESLRISIFVTNLIHITFTQDKNFFRLEFQGRDLRRLSTFNKLASRSEKGLSDR